MGDRYAVKGSDVIEVSNGSVVANLTTEAEATARCAEMNCCEGNFKQSGLTVVDGKGRVVETCATAAEAVAKAAERNAAVETAPTEVYPPLVDLEASKTERSGGHRSHR